MKNTIALITLIILSVSAFAEMPPKPDKYITDNSHLLPTDAVNRINEKLAQFERDTSDQVIVYLTPELPSEDVDSYTTELMHEWGVGQKGKSNGVGLFIFTDKRIASLRTGYGVEGVLPDATTKQIRVETLNPRWKEKNYTAAIEDTTNRIMATIKGEYKGNGKTVAESAAISDGMLLLFLCGGGLLLLFIIWIAKKSTGSGSSYGGGYSGGSYYGSSGLRWIIRQ